MEQKHLLVRITLLSALILFLEMLLIRWIGTEVRIFAYLQNGVLVVSQTPSVLREIESLLGLLGQYR